MLFTEFGNIANPPILLLHGMMQDWHTEYEMLKPLEEHYRLIIPAQDGFYDGSKDFISFADQARQIEEYIHRNQIFCGSIGVNFRFFCIIVSLAISSANLDI